MNRRAFFKICIFGVSFIKSTASNAYDIALKISSSFLLSKDGSTRATGYENASKIITIKDTTFITWVDTNKNGFLVKARQLNRNTNVWSPIYTVGLAYDNHGGAAMTIDSKGFLHIAYYPHGHPVRYRKSKRPLDVSSWHEEIQFGDNCTYPTLLCGNDDTLYLTCRTVFPVIGFDPPAAVSLWIKKVDKTWEKSGNILKSRYTGYAHFAESLCWSNNKQALHLFCRFHEKSDKNFYGQIQTLGYMVSYDYGKTWKDSSGYTITKKTESVFPWLDNNVEPATADSIEIIFQGGLQVSSLLRPGHIAVDKYGIPHIAYSIETINGGTTYLSYLESKRSWKHINLNKFLPRKYEHWQVINPAGVTFDKDNKIFVVATIQNITQKDRDPKFLGAWGHPSNEVICFQSSDINNGFNVSLLSELEPRKSNWLPSLEKDTGFNSQIESPGVIYTSGKPGKNNSEKIINDVFWVNCNDENKKIY